VCFSLQYKSVAPRRRRRRRRFTGFSDPEACTKQKRSTGERIAINSPRDASGFALEI
jgi:hypothetical protein